LLNFGIPKNAVEIGARIDEAATIEMDSLFSLILSVVAHIGAVTPPEAH
jgi:hypothetical protein